MLSADSSCLHKVLAEVSTSGQEKSMLRLLPFHSTKSEAQWHEADEDSEHEAD